jgi:hypothetical protein
MLNLRHVLRWRPDAKTTPSQPHATENQDERHRFWRNECSAPHLARQLFARLGAGRRPALGRDDKATLNVRGETVHKARADDEMPLELLGQGFQECAPLQRWIGAAAAWTAAYSASLRLSGMGGRLRRARATMPPCALRLQGAVGRRTFQAHDRMFQCGLSDSAKSADATP